MSYEIETTAWNIAANAVNAAYEAMDAHSPSRKMFALGEFGDLGLINGFLSLSGRVSDTAYNVGDDAVKSMRDAIESISVDSIDATPVISPVLDLSNVEDGASRIGGLFANNSISLSNQNGNLFNSNTEARLDAAGRISIDDSNMVSEISMLRGEVSSLTDYISKLKIQLDSGALVGQLVEPMDEALGRQFAMAERGL